MHPRAPFAALQLSQGHSAPVGGKGQSEAALWKTRPPRESTASFQKFNLENGAQPLVDLNFQRAF